MPGERAASSAARIDRAGRERADGSREREPRSRPGTSVYVDTSAVVKLFVVEDHSEAVRTAVRDAEAVVTSRLTFVETHATFARMETDGQLDGDRHEQAAAAFDELWADLVVVAISDRVMVRGAALARRHDLRAYDALQLACALELAGPAEATRFLSFEAQLEAAAASEGLSLLARTG